MLRSEFERIQEKQTWDFLDSDNSTRMLNNAPPGAGKTTITGQVLDDAGELYTYLPTTHKLINEHNINLTGYDLPHLIGRQRACLNEEGKLLMIHGINIKNILCTPSTCPHYEECKRELVWRQINNNPQSWTGPQAFLGNLTNVFVRKRGSVGWGTIIIDENPIESITKKHRFYPAMLQKTLDFLSTFQESSEQSFMIFVANILLESIRLGQLNAKSIAERITKYGQERTSLMLADFCKKYEQALYDELQNGKLKDLHNIVTPLAGFTKEVLNNPDPDYVAQVFKLFKGKSQTFIDAIRFDLEAFDIGCKLLFLDGTTSVDIYRRLLQGHEIKAMFDDRDIASTNLPNTQAVQISSHKFVKSTLENSEKTLKKLLRIVKLIATWHNEPVVVFARHVFHKWITDQSPLITAAHYNSKGTNDFRDYRVGVLFGAPEQSHDVIDRMAALMHCTKDEYTHMMREEEMVQDIFRTAIRKDYNNPVKIYLLTNIPIQILEHNQQLTTEQLLGNLEAKNHLRDILKNGPIRYTNVAKAIKQFASKKVSASSIIQSMIKDGTLKCMSRGNIMFIELAESGVS